MGYLRCSISFTQVVTFKCEALNAPRAISRAPSDCYPRHYPVRAESTTRTKFVWVISAAATAAARGEEAPREFLPAFSSSFFSVPRFSCSAVSVKTALSTQGAQQGWGAAAYSPAATTYLLLAEMPGTGGVSAPHFYTDDEKIKDNIVAVPRVSISPGWQLCYMFSHSEYLVSSGFSAKTKDKKCQVAFSLLKNAFYGSAH